MIKGERHELSKNLQQSIRAGLHGCMLEISTVLKSLNRSGRFEEVKWPSQVSPIQADN